MADRVPPAADDLPPRDGFPVGTVFATLLGLFLFVGLVAVLYTNSPGGPADRTDPALDPYTRKQEVDARNRRVIDGAEPGIKPMAVAVPEYAARVKGGDPPFPARPAAAAPAPPPKDAGKK